MKTFVLAILAILSMLTELSLAQGKWSLKETEQLPFEPSMRWGTARFSPDGSKLYLTSQSYNGIWEYTFETRVTRKITADPGSGYAFALSADGTTLSYRRSIDGNHPRDRKQEILSVDLRTGVTRKLGSARTLSAPTFQDSRTVFLEGSTLRNAPPKNAEVALLGIDNQKIALLVGGERKTLDPFENGSYIWPALSPDGKRLAAYGMDRGAFVCEIHGSAIVRLGRADRPVWTRDGDWLVFFKEENDGHEITGSDLYAIHGDGTERTRLTFTPDRIELDPFCSPVDDRIVCRTLDGKILVFTYEVHP